MLTSAIADFLMFGYWFFTPVNILIAVWHKVKKGSFFPNLSLALIFFLQLAYNLFVIYVSIANNLHLVRFSEYFLQGFIMYIFPATMFSCFYCVLQCYYFFVWERRAEEAEVPKGRLDNKTK